MAVHVFDTQDSDGDSWMEVLEGSPGPTVQNSTASSSSCSLKETDEHTHTIFSTDEDESWASDFEYPNDSKSDCNNHGCSAISSTTNGEPPHQTDRTQRTTDSSADTNCTNSLHTKSLRDRPEIGDIRNHFHEVENISKSEPDKAAYYRSWLCWMYLMRLSEIREIVDHAPDYIINVANNLFGLQNHPFWKASDKSLCQWYAMYGACTDIFTWWNTQWRHQTANSSNAPCLVPYDQIINVQGNDCSCLPPWTLGDALKFLDKTYTSVLSSCPPDGSGQRAIPFQIWVQWVHQAKGQSASISPLPWPPQPRSVGESDNAICAYTQSIGLPPEAANYPHLFTEHQ